MNILKQKEMAKRIHPKLTNSVLAVYDEPKVKKAIETLGKFGLGAFLPHKHDKNDKMIPLPSDEFQDENDLKISFKKHAEIPEDEKGIFVGWRADENGKLNFSSYCCPCTSCKKC